MRLMFKLNNFFIRIIIMRSNLSNQDRADLSRARNVLVASNDSRFDYHFVKYQGDIDNFDQTPTIITMDRYDYSIKADEGNDMELPKLFPLSLASCQNNLEDMEAFYAAKFPRLPSEYHGILARYSSGDILTKKDVKNTIKRANKKNRELPVGFTIAKKDIEINFD